MERAEPTCVDRTEVWTSSALPGTELGKSVHTTHAFPRHFHDTYVVEIKAAAIDMVAEAALERGVKLVFADNEVVPLPGETDLDELFRGLAPSTVRA